MKNRFMYTTKPTPLSHPFALKLVVVVSQHCLVSTSNGVLHGLGAPLAFLDLLWVLLHTRGSKETGLIGKVGRIG